MEAAMHRSRLLLPIFLLLVAGALRGGEHCTAIVLDNFGHTVFGANFDHNLTDEGLVFINKRGVAKTATTPGKIARRTGSASPRIGSTVSNPLPTPELSSTPSTPSTRSGENDSPSSRQTGVSSSIVTPVSKTGVRHPVA